MKRLGALVALLALTALPAAAETRMEIGLLDCVVQGGTGFIVGSSKNVSCTFHAADGRSERYSGVIRKFGLDIGRTTATYIKWGVLAPTVNSYKPGALAGRYVGVSGEATVGVGLGGNALIGGSDKTFVLQPVSVQAQQGLNLAAGLTSFELRARR